MKVGKVCEHSPPTPAQIEAARGHFFVPGYRYPPLPKRPQRELTPREKESVAEKRAQVHAMGQVAVDFIAELHKEGMIDGWRGVVSVVRHVDEINTSAGYVEKTGEI